MPKYFALIDKTTGTVKGHTFIEGMYKSGPNEEIKIHNGEWPHDETGDVARNSTCKWDVNKVRTKTQTELNEARKL